MISEEDFELLKSKKYIPGFKFSFITNILIPGFTSIALRSITLPWASTMFNTHSPTKSSLFTITWNAFPDGFG